MGAVRNIQALALSAMLLAGPLSAAEGNLEERVSRLERQVDAQVLRDLLRRLDALQREVQVLRDQGERTAHELELLKSRSRELYLDLDRRISGGDPSAPVAGETAESPPLDGGAPVSGSSASMAVTEGRSDTGTGGASTGAGLPGADQAYRRAFDTMREGGYPQAAEAFGRFLVDYPGSVRAADARYWQGEAYYAMGNYPSAKASFEAVTRLDPASAKAPDARLKLGFTHYALEEWGPARTVLTEVAERYPGTTVSRLAAERLREMDRDGH